MSKLDQFKQNLLDEVDSLDFDAENRDTLTGELRPHFVGTGVLKSVDLTNMRHTSSHNPKGYYIAKVGFVLDDDKGDRVPLVASLMLWDTQLQKLDNDFIANEEYLIFVRIIKDSKGNNAFVGTFTGLTRGGDNNAANGDNFAKLAAVAIGDSSVKVAATEVKQPKF